MTTILVNPDRLRDFADQAGDAITTVTRSLSTAMEVADHWHDAAGFRSPSGLLDDVAHILQRLLRLLAVAGMVADQAERLDRRLADHHLVGLVGRLSQRSSRTADLAWALDGLDDPVLVASLWRVLTDTQRSALVRGHPEVIGRLDGVAPAMRDAANRRHIMRTRAGLHGQIRALEDDATRLARIDDAVGGVSADAAVARATRLKARMAALDRMLAADQILLWDPSRDGKAIVAWGDPATATHVATFIPGMSNSLATFDRVMADSRALHGGLKTQLGVAAPTPATRSVQPHQATGDASVATVAWLGYDAPSGLGWGVDEAASDHAAIAQTDNLADWTHGLRQVNPGMVHTIIAHSYGSVLAGQALAAGRVDDRQPQRNHRGQPAPTPLRIDRLVVLGSPGLGTGIDTIEDLGLVPGQMVTVSNPGDVVPHLPVLGPAPDAFGDVVQLPVGPGNRDHSDYLVPDTLGLTNVSRTVLGLPPLPRSTW